MKTNKSSAVKILFAVKVGEPDYAEQLITDQAYLVLSVHDCRQLLRAAVASQRAHKASATHCIILERLDVKILGNGENPQISSTDVNARVAEIESEAKKTLRKSPKS